MSGFIPKEKLTAYERWELAAFDEPEPKPVESVPETAPPAPALPPEPPPEEVSETVPLPTAEEVEQIHNEAYQAGYEAGYAEGAQQAEQETRRLQTLIDGLEQSLKEVDQEVADQLLGLALEVANQVMRQSLKTRPELLLPIVRDAMAALPPHQHPHPSLFLHAEDAALVRQHLGEQLGHSGWRIIESEEISRGGCRIEAGASEVDATEETRWRHVLDAIGADTAWLAQRG